MTLAEALAALDAKASLTADDALTIRQIVYGDGIVVNQDEAETLFRLNADAGEISPEWRALYIEAMTDYVVREQAPVGYVNDAKAQWLIALVSTRSKLRGDEIEALLHVLEEADEVPATLAAFVLGVVRSVALWRLRTAGALTALDIERLRRAIFAKGGESNVAVTREEAEALFDINDAQKPDADPAWSDFFARAVGNAVLFVPVWQADAATELSHEAWLADTTIHPLQRLQAAFTGDHLQRGAAEGFSDIFHMDFESADLKRLGEREAADEATEDVAAAVTADEAHWLIDRMDRNGDFDAAERALVAFLKENASSIDPALADYIAKLGGDHTPASLRAAS
jgi:hypothetical protein